MSRRDALRNSRRSVGATLNAIFFRSAAVRDKSQSTEISAGDFLSSPLNVSTAKRTRAMCIAITGSCISLHQGRSTASRRSAKVAIPVVLLGNSITISYCCLPFIGQSIECSLEAMSVGAPVSQHEPAFGPQQPERERGNTTQTTQNHIYIGVNSDASSHILCFVRSDSCNTVTYFPWQGGLPNVWQKCCSVSVTRRAEARLQMHDGIPWRRGGKMSGRRCGESDAVDPSKIITSRRAT